MRRLFTVLLVFGSLSAAFASDAAADSSPAKTASASGTGRVIKVLPFFLDREGHAALSPSLFDRDAYQAYLRQHTNEISAIRFDVLWKASGVEDEKCKLRVELRGSGAGGVPRQAALEQDVKPGFFRHWISLRLGGTEYKSFGELIAWRVTLWSGNRMLGEQKSFLW